LAVHENPWGALDTGAGPAVRPAQRSPYAPGPPSEEPRALRLDVLGSDRAAVQLGERALALPRRQTEVLVLLALHPRGLTAEQIALELHGDFGKPVTARAEISRLRHALDIDLGARPYRLPAPPRGDFVEVELLLRHGFVAEALCRYAGPMLPYSEAPSIVEAREALDHSLREAVLASGEVDLMYAWLRSPAGGDDLDACRQLAARLEHSDPRRASVLSRLRRLCASAY
jgi:hypothetical protein